MSRDEWIILSLYAPIKHERWRWWPPMKSILSRHFPIKSQFTDLRKGRCCIIVTCSLLPLSAWDGVETKKWTERMSVHSSREMSFIIDILLRHRLKPGGSGFFWDPLHKSVWRRCEHSSLMQRTNAGRRWSYIAIGISLSHL